MDELDNPVTLKEALRVIYDEAEAALSNGEAAVMKKALDNIRAVARYKFNVLADADRICSK